MQRENDQALEIEYESELRKLDRDARNKFKEGKIRIQQQLETMEHELDDDQQNNVLLELEGNLRSELESEYLRRFNELREEYKDFLSRKEGTHTEPEPASQEEQEEQEEVQRKTVLSRLYSLSGDVKTPMIVDMLKRWLADPTKGKLCIFAHHISVLDALELQAGLSNAPSSKTKFIRIDGATLPKQRQEQINEFQTDPLVRIALLGITAAGVAVTLTASSTVWFAELFWTPAIMIQAEDRCHRIGQQARVKCLYIVAKGTLDDILWKLIEKKFRDLGEFVEGKEKLKLVVDKIYHNEKELYSIFSNEDASHDGIEDVDQEDFENFMLGVELEHDIEELGEEEQKMLMLSETSDDNDGEPGDSEDSKVPAIEGGKVESSLGASEDAAIALLDDDDDDSEVSETEAEWLDLRNNRVTRLDVPLLDCRCYKIVIGESRLGVDVTLFHSRIVIKEISRSRLDRLGPHSKPSVGDVLVAVNGHRLALVSSLLPVMQYLQKLFQNPPVELSFVEIPSFITRFKEHIATYKNMITSSNGGSNRAAARAARQQEAANKEIPDAVIDLADDD
jgi:SWI/SNF-related matrix-associated actin-dependent regulator 1 of chromatin subfamily A